MKNDILLNPLFFLVLYLFIINIYSFTIMGIDKWKSIKRKWRTPEYVFFLAALLGGAAGAYAGMHVFHHKTLHAKFKIGMPIILFINVFLVYYIIKAL